MDTTDTAVWTLRHVNPVRPNEVISFEIFRSEADAWEAYQDSAQVIADVGGACVLVNPQGEQIAKTSRRVGGTAL